MAAGHMTMAARALQACAAAAGYRAEITFVEDGALKTRVAMPCRAIEVAVDGVPYRWEPINDDHNSVFERYRPRDFWRARHFFREPEERQVPFRAFALCDAEGRRLAAILYSVSSPERQARRLNFQHADDVRPVTLGRLLLQLEARMRFQILPSRHDRIAYDLAAHAHLVGNDLVDDLPVAHSERGWDFRFSSAGVTDKTDERLVLATRPTASGGIEFVTAGVLSANGVYRVDPPAPHLPGLHDAVVAAINANAFGPAQPGQPTWAFYRLEDDGRATCWTDQVIATLPEHGNKGSVTHHLLRDGASVMVLTERSALRCSEDGLGSVDGPLIEGYWARNGEPFGRFSGESRYVAIFNELRLKAGFDTVWNGTRWQKPKPPRPVAVKAPPRSARARRAN